MLLAYLQLQILDFLELHIPSSKKSELELCQAGTIQSHFCPELRFKNDPISRFSRQFASVPPLEMHL
jgi:hypothetical protein